MTKEDAIDIIRRECYVFNPLNFDMSITINMALDMAVKALEKETKPMVEIDLDYVIKQKYIEREVLDKIKAEIRQQQWYLDVANVNRVIGIIDKYTAESED